MIFVDRFDKAVGSGSKLHAHRISCHLPLHRAFSIFSFNNQGKLLIHQRSDEKLLFPSFWSNTCCSHPLANEYEMGNDRNDPIVGVKRAAARRIREELGISEKSDSFVHVGRVHYRAQYNDTWGEHELDHILFQKLSELQEASLAPFSEEVAATRYVSQCEMRDLLKADAATLASDQPGVRVTPWMRLLCTDWPLFDLWSAFESQSAEEFAKTVQTVVGKEIRCLGPDATKLASYEPDLSRIPQA